MNPTFKSKRSECRKPMEYFIPIIFLIIVFILNSALGATYDGTSYPQQVHRRVLRKLQDTSKRVGFWSSWSSWSHCSRPCGTGIKIQYRQCLPKIRRKMRNLQVNDVKCLGRNKRYQLCSTHPCKKDAMDFREIQCSKYNKVSFSQNIFRWQPFIENDNSCVLNCRPIGMNFYATLNKTVVDGTPCGGLQQYQGRRPNKFCIEGRCTKMGCDGILDSGTELDACGLCGGNNSSCRLITGVYGKDRLPLGYNLIASIPAKAKNISFSHMEPTKNFLAIRDSEGNYLLNGPSALNVSGNFVGAGTIFTYFPPDLDKGDFFTASGPTTQAINIMVFYKNLNPGIKYEYRLPLYNEEYLRENNFYNTAPGVPTSPLQNPLGTVVYSSQKKYKYPFSPMSSASTNLEDPLHPSNFIHPYLKSGSARKFSKIVNPPASKNEVWHPPKNYPSKIPYLSKQFLQTRASSSKKLRTYPISLNDRFSQIIKDKDDLDDEDFYVSSSKRKSRWEERTRKKKNRGAKFLWVAQGFTACSHECAGGTQSPRYICVRKNNKRREVPVDYCAHLKTPDKRLQCNMHPCQPEWEADEWGPCSVTCGLGIQLRKLYCSRRISTNQTVNVPKYLCEDTPLLTVSQVCQKRDCEGPPYWIIGQWSSCSSPCGLGTRRRNVTCSFNLDCPRPAPADEEICDLGSCATDTWFFSEWHKQCKGPCGNGFQLRSVHCVGNSVNESQTNTCSKTSKPFETRSCKNKEKCGGSWFAGPWSLCDPMCGKGQQRRSVVCVLWVKGKYKISKDYSLCKASGEMPVDTRACILECTLQWFTSEWSQCSRRCDGGVQRREVKCLDDFLLPSMDCSISTKPDSRQACNAHPCERSFVNRSDNEVETSFEEQFPNDESDSSIFPTGACVDRMKNCNLVFKARLCKLRYYYKLCCQSCSKQVPD